MDKARGIMSRLWRIVYLSWQIARIKLEGVEGEAVSRYATSRYPAPDALRLFADWFDYKYPNDTNPEAQNDLRRWADNIEAHGDSCHLLCSANGKMAMTRVEDGYVPNTN